MAMYTFGGTPADVLTDTAGNAIADYPLIVRAAGTGEQITALLEADGTTPIAQLRTNSAVSTAPGRVRPFKIDGVTAIEYEYNTPGGGVLRWYQGAREASSGALDQIEGKLDKSGGTLTGKAEWGMANATDVILAGFKASTTADTQDRFRLTADGAMAWGPGNAARDTSLSRTGPGVLETPGTLLAGQVSLVGMKIFNPRLWGTGGAALQAVLNAARDAGGGWVIVPSGTWDASALPLRIYGQTRLTLLEGATIRRAGAGTMLLNGDAAQSYGGYTGHGNITIEGGTWDARATAYPTSAMCMSIGHAENITIRDTLIKDVAGYHGIEINAVKTCRITNVRGLGYLDPGGRDFSEFIQPDLAKGSAYFGGFGPYDDTPVVDLVVEGCTVGPSGTPGTTAWPRGVGSHSASPGKPHTGIVIRDLYCEGLTQWAVGGYTWQDCTVTGLTLKNCGAGVRMRTLDSANASHRTPAGGGAPTITGSEPLRNIAIEGVTMYGGGSYDAAVRVEGEDTGYVQGLRVAGITTRDIGSQAVRLVDVEDYTVDEVLARSCGATGVSTLGTRRGRIRAHVNGATGAGISVDSRSTPAAAATDVILEGCSVTGTTANGIHIWDGTDVIVDDCDLYALTGYGVQISTNTVRPVVRHSRSRDTTLAGLNVTNTITGLRRYGNTFGSVADASSGAETSPFDSGFGAVEDAIRPAGRWETTSRMRCGGESQPTSGWLYLIPVWLPKGTPLSAITFTSGNTAGAGLTNHWFTLHNASRVALARTADATTAAWAANTAKSLAIAQTTAGAASSYTTTYTGLHYYGFMIAATTTPSLIGEGRLITGGTSAPGLGATNSGQTTPPTVTAGAFTAAAFAGSAILAYGYAA
ncbi:MULTISPECIES: right-handed parallel beta-helix repeat-containing protein [Streptomyces]